MEDRSRSSRPAPLLALVGLLFGSATSAAQEAASALPGVFSEVLDVRVVNLEVVVTDKDGVPVHGLRPGDFVLKVDGEEVAIDYFSEIRGGQATAAREGEDRQGVAEMPAIVPGSPIGTSYLIFIDEFFSISRDRNQVLDALLEDLPFLGPEDRMAVVAYDGKDLEMLSTWSSSVPALERVLEKAKLRPAHGLKRRVEQRQFDYDRLLDLTNQIRAGSVAADRIFRTEFGPVERFHISRLTDQVERTIAAATATVRSFAQPPGRKTMVLLSGGWPFVPAQFLDSFASGFILDSDYNRGPAIFRSLADTANLLGYTLYPVDVPGLRGESVDVGAAGLVGTSGQPRSTFLREQELQHTLNFLAQETGGRALLNARRLEAFERVVSDTRTYYWIGFSPQRAWDDARHNIEVGVRTAGLRVRSREGFLDSSREHEVTMAVESALLFGNPPGEELLQVKLGEPRKAGRGKMEVTVSVGIPLDELTFVPVGGRQRSELEVRIAVRDEEGRRAEIPVIPIALESNQPPAPGEMGNFETRIKLRRQTHQAVVAVYDRASGRILSTTTEFRPSG